MLIRNRMSKNVVSVEPQHSVAEARALLRKHGIHHLPVLRKQRLVGVVTDRDVRSVATDTTRIEEVMTTDPVVLGPDAFVDEAARLLRRHRIGGLPIVEHNHLVGMLTAADVLDAFVDISGAAEPTYKLILSGAKGKPAEQRVRDIILKGRGELKWMQRDTRDATRLHLRLKARRMDDILYGLEAAGFAVSTIMAPPSARR